MPLVVSEIVWGVVALTLLNASEVGVAVMMPVAVPVTFTGIWIGVKPTPVSWIVPCPGGTSEGLTLTRIVNGASVEETRQMNVVVKLNRDQLGRDDRNLRTGYLVDWFDWNELKSPNEVGSSTKPENVSSNAGTR